MKKHPTKNKTLAFLLAITIMAVAWTSCTERIDLELGDTYTRLVVETILTDRMKSHELILTNTSGYFSNEPAPRVGNAGVTVSDGSRRWRFQQHEPGRYVAEEEFSLQTGKEYHLEIAYNSRIYRASSRVKPVPPIDSLTVGPHIYLRDHIELRVHFQEPAGSNDFYMWKVYHNGEDLTNSAVRVRSLSDEFVNGQYLHLPFFLFNPQDGLPEAGDHIRVEMYSIGEGYFDFLSALRRNRGAVGGPFNGPPANIPGNIDNGALGFFLAASVSEAELMISMQ